MSNIIVDPALKALIPPLSAEERDLLEQNILAHGCRDPLVVWQGVLLDGHNRLEICEKHDLPYETAQLEFDSIEQARVWMRDNQMGRRNLSTAWRIDLHLANKEDLAKIGAAKYKDTVGRPPKESLSQIDNDKPPAPKHDTRKEIAKAANTSTGMVGMAEVVRKQAPELWEKAKADEVTVSAAYKDFQKKQRTQQIAAERKALAESAKDVPKSAMFKLACCDLAEYESPQLVDVIITDPPYPKEFLPLWSVLAQKANEWLKPGGLLVAMSGQAYLDQVYAMLSEHLDYYWTACYHTPGQPTPLRQVNVNTTWKPLLIYKRSGERYSGRIFGDFMKSDQNEKDFHKWGQSVSGMDQVLERFALPGQTVLDPFCGAGTTGVSAVKRGCKFYGCELEQENVDISIARISEAAK